MPEFHQHCTSLYQKYLSYLAIQEILPTIHKCLLILARYFKTENADEANSEEFWTVLLCRNKHSQAFLMNDVS